MAYHNAGREKYLGKDENAFGIADSPGDKKAKAASPEAKSGRAAETARPQASADMTGKQSMPEMKTNLKVHTVAVKGGGSQEGCIKNTSGDAHAYLGHFRSPEVLKRGHNQGAPGLPMGDKTMAPPPIGGKAPGVSGAGAPPPVGSAGKLGAAATPSSPKTLLPPVTSSPTPAGKLPGVGGAVGPVSGVAPTPATPAAPVVRPATVKPLGGPVNALTNPIAAARASNKAKLAATPAGGGARREVKRVNKLNLGAAKEARRARDKEGFGKSDRAALKGLRKANRAARRA